MYELLIQLTDFALDNATAHYNAFAVGTEAEGYDLRLLGQYDGDAGDSLSYHASMKFSTHDMDQDQWPDGNCARDHTGGWWYRGCDTRLHLFLLTFLLVWFMDFKFSLSKDHQKHQFHSLISIADLQRNTESPSCNILSQIHVRLS